MTFPLENSGYVIDSGPWGKLVRMQDLGIALHQRYVAGKESIEVVLEASKREIPNNIEALQSHETVMRNFLGLFELATFSKEGSAQDKHLKAWIEFMQRTGSEKLFPNLTTAANENESMRVLLRERRQNGTTLES